MTERPAPISDPPALLASTATGVGSAVSVVLGVLVAVDAVILREIDRGYRFATKRVLSGRNWPKMVGVHASAVATPVVIQHEAVRHGTVGSRPGVLVGSDHPIAEVEQSVAGTARYGPGSTVGSLPPRRDATSDQTARQPKGGGRRCFRGFGVAVRATGNARDGTDQTVHTHPPRSVSQADSIDFGDRNCAAKSYEGD